MNRWLWLFPFLILSLGFVACGDDGGGGDDDDDDDMMMGDDDDDMGRDPPPILVAIAGEEDLSSLSNALDVLVEEGIITDELLLGLELLPGPTVFAPTNEGFDAAVAALGIEDLETASEEQLTQLLGVIAHHIVAASLPASDITGDGAPGSVPSLLGSTEPDAPDDAGVKLYFDTSDGVALRYFGLDPADQTELASTVTEADVDVPDDEDAVIHKVDQVIIPPNVFRVAILEGLTGFVGAVGAADPVPGTDPAVPVEVALADPEANYTAFVPDNDAFDGVGEVPAPQLTGILLYHVLNEENPVFSTTDPLPARADALAGFTMLLDIAEGQVNGGSGGPAPVLGANITGTDILASNGVIHVIDNVLTPPTVGAMAQIAGLTELVTAVLTADGAAGAEDPIILDVLNDPAATLTVLAPTDMAFQDATGPGGPAEGVDTDTLREALLYHVVSGEALASGDLSDGDTLETLSMAATQQPTVSVAGDGAITFTDQAGQTITPVDGLIDIRVVNGIVHVVDTVLLPLSL